MSEIKYHVRFDEVTPYHPANHTGTANRRLIGLETGSKRIEMLHGTIEPGQGALPHLHPRIDQVCYVLEGRAHVEVAGHAFEMVSGDSCFFPAGEKHLLKVLGTEPVKILVIYTPPYGENPAEVVR